MFLRASGRRPARRTWALGAAAAATAATLLLAGCSGGSSSSASSADAADTLIAYTGQSGDYQINFNPYSPSQIGGIGTIFESLFFITNVNTDPYTPLLGTDYSWSDDGTQLSVTLRDGVTWSDGEPFTAKDVKFTFDLLAKTRRSTRVASTAPSRRPTTATWSSPGRAPPSSPAPWCWGAPRSCPSTSGPASTRRPT
jgi:peptide/nickel transport system substrate-binding protein